MSSNESGNGIKLPPILFLSGQEDSANGNGGVMSTLNKDDEEPLSKKVKFDRSDQRGSDQRNEAIVSDKNSENGEILSKRFLDDSQQQAGTHNDDDNKDNDDNDDNNNHHDHHHHHHLDHHDNHHNPSQDTNQNSIPHKEDGQYIRGLDRNDGFKDGETVTETNLTFIPNSNKKENVIVESNQTYKTKDLSKAQILDIIQTVFPDRRHLGSLVYNPTTTWLTLQTSQLTGLKDEHFEKFEELRESYRDKLKEEFYNRSVKYIPMIPPLPTDYINYLLEIKIPHRFIKSFKQEFLEGKIERKRELWGGQNGIYTDDSDILTVLYHMGFFNDNIDLTEWNELWTPQDIIVPEINKDKDIKGDLSVTLLILPSLSNYHGFYANGINSRSWKEINRHDGLSYAVSNIKWEIENSYLRDKSFFKRYQTEVAYDLRHMKHEESWDFDVKYYKQLKQKYEQEKTENVTNDNV